jgi:multimeric flavodoxin WrbA
MKILGVCCSPRRNGNTEILLREALSSAEEEGAETKFITVSGKKILGCEGCDSCAKTNKCKIDDDMQILYPEFLEADGIIFGSPIYAWSLSSQAKAIIDRTFCLKRDTLLRNKVGGVVLVTYRVGHVGAFGIFAGFFTTNRMIMAGSAMAFGLEKGAVRNDTQGMAEAKSLGKVVVKYGKVSLLLDQKDLL